MTDQLKQLPEAATEDRFLIMKRDLYYMPEGKGYTGVKKQAGRFSLSDTAVRFPDCDDSGLSFIHEDEAPEFSKACFEDIKLAVLRQERDEADDQAVALEAQLAETQLAENGAMQIIAGERVKVLDLREQLAEAKAREAVVYEAAWAFMEAKCVDECSLEIRTRDDLEKALKEPTTALEQIKQEADKAGFERGVREAATKAFLAADVDARPLAIRTAILATLSEPKENSGG